MRRKAHIINSCARHTHRVWTFYVQGWRIRKGGTKKGFHIPLSRTPGKKPLLFFLICYNKVKKVIEMEWNDIYDADRHLTGRQHLRGTPWAAGEYGLTVCVWVYDGKGNLLLTKRAPEKTYPGTWENSGGAARAGESSLQAIARELFEETGIRAEKEEFELLSTGRDDSWHYDFYCLKKDVPLSEIRLQPGETVDVQWADFRQVHRMVESGEICSTIGKQFLAQEKDLLTHQLAQD